MLILIRGAGDIASGIALRLWRSGLQVVMTDIPMPTAVRRTVSFCEALRLGSCRVEEVTARACGPAEMEACLAAGEIPVLADPDAAIIRLLHPDAVVDAILAKRNPGTAMTDAPVVIGVGPGFTAGVDCHAVVETKRGHSLGRVIRQGSAIPNTGIPGNIGGYTTERVLRSPADGIFQPVLSIGDRVEPGQIAALVGGLPMICTIPGILRGLLAEGTPVTAGMKAGDIDPRCRRENCFTVSDKASAVGGGVLEAILSLTGVLRNHS